MRFLFCLAAGALLVMPAASAAEPAGPLTGKSPLKLNACPRTGSYAAGDGAVHRGTPPSVRKLTQLPPAIGYMAVYRTVNGCEFPMTVTEYRGGRPGK